MVVPPELLPAAVTLQFDAQVIGFCAATALLVGLLFGLAPAWKATGFDAVQEIVAASRTSTARSRKQQGVLVAAEVAMAVLLLYGAGLLLRTLIAVDSVDLGFRASRVLTIKVDPLASECPTPELLLGFWDQVEREIGTIPGVESTAWTTALPLRVPEDGQVAFDIVGQPPFEALQRPIAEAQVVSPAFFSTVDLAIVTGRAFDDRDTLGKPMVGIISEAFARRYAQGRSAVGMRVALRPAQGPGTGPRFEIVGVARQVKPRPGEVDEPIQLYVPLAQRPEDDLFVAIRTATTALQALAPAVRAAIARVDRKQLVAVRDANTLDGLAWNATARHRFRAVLVTTLAALALVLAMAGVFGILAYSVQQRVREIGVRRALGTSTGDVVRLVALRAGRLIAIGIAVGLTLATVSGRFIAAMLFEVEPLDPITFASVTIVLVLAAVAATAAPAWRAVHVDPAIALHNE